MRNLLLQPCALQPFLPKRFFKSASFKPFYFGHFPMALLFWFGGNAECDFMNIDKNNSTSAATFRTSLVAMKRSGLNTSSLTSLTDYFRSRQSGNWATLSTWESSPDNINWQLATEVPTKDANTITVQTGHTVSVTNSITLDQTAIAGVLELQTGGILNINDGAGDDITIFGNGVLQITSTNSYATAILQNSGANIHVAANGKILIGNGGSVGTGYENFATSLVNVWDDRAVYEFNSSGTFTTSGLTYFPNAATTDIPIFRVTKVAATTMNSPAGFTINGLIEINTNVSFSGTGKKYFRNGIRGNATLSQISGGKFYLTASGAILDGPSLKIVLSSVMDLSPSSTIIPSGANVTITGANINNTPTNPPGSHGDLTIHGTLDVTTVNITNTGTSKITVNGTYRTAHPGGFSGPGSSIPANSPPGIIDLNPGSTIELYSSGNQSLNARPDFKNIIFSGSGIKTPNGPFSPNGTITIKDDAIFDCSGVVNAINIGDDNTNLTMTDNSRLIVSGFGPNPKMGGIYNLTGGVVEFKNKKETPQTVRSKNYQNIEITGTNVLMSDGNITLNDQGTFTIKKDGIFTINDNTINGPTGTQTVTVESGGRFKCGNVKGFHGFTLIPAPIVSSAINSDIENIILQPNSIVEYSRSQPPLSSGDQPITTVNGLIYQNLILSGTGNKTAPPDDLIIQGNLSKTGTCNFIHNDGTVILNGNSIQTYISTSPQMVFNNLTNDNTSGLNIEDNLSVSKNLLLGNNSKINLNADITLQSGKNNTANMSAIPATAIINYLNGRFIVERYINTGIGAGYHLKSWQFLSTPAFGETVHDTWQEKGNKTIANYGTWITDPAGTSKGFDAVSFSPSLKYYNPSMNNWIGIENTDINIENEKGYMIFIRGDRLATDLNSPATPTTLRTKGKLYSPAAGFNPPSITVDAYKYQSIGNPYASVIDFTKLNKTPNVDNSFYVWDPALGGNYGVGGYQTITAATGFRATPGGTSIYNTMDDYRNIQSGQAFFVHNSSASIGSVTFSEATKTDAAHHLVNRDSIPGWNETGFLFASVFTDNGEIVDGNAVVFGNRFSNKIDRDDAVKINNSGGNIGIKREGKILAVESRQKIQNTDTVFYNLSDFSKQKYRLKFVPENMQDGFEAILFDRHLKTELPISLTDTTFYEFPVTDDPSSSVANRFFVVFKIAATPLAFSFLSLNAYEKNNSVFVEWNVENENNLKYYEIEHSNDGIYFSVKGKITAGNNLNSSYSFIDNAPVEGKNYYRISSLGTDDKKTYSGTAEVFFENIKPGISVYPNPLSDENINLQFINQPAGKYKARLLNSSGQTILSKVFNHEGGTGLLTLKLKANIAHGMYQLEIISPDGTKNMIRIKK